MSQMIIEEEILIFVGGVRKIIISVVFHFLCHMYLDCFVKQKLCSFKVM